MSDFETLLVERRGTTCWISMNRPEALNSINTQVVRDLDRAVDEIAAADYAAVRTVVITGVGRAFCAGGDLKEMEDGAGGYRSGSFLYGAISNVLVRLEQLDRPVIAAVNGLCVAGGLEIALACDFVIASERAMFGDGHANFGLLPGGGGSVRLPRKVGPNRAALMMMTGKLFPSRTMLEWGLVAEIAAEDSLPAAADALALTLASKSPLGLTQMKQAIARGLEQPLHVALEAEQARCKLHDASFDRNEGLAAFVAKRAPEFRGK